MYQSENVVSVFLSLDIHSNLFPDLSNYTNFTQFSSWFINIPPCVYIYIDVYIHQILLIYSTVGSCLFHFLAIMNGAIIIMNVQTFL